MRILATGIALSAALAASSPHAAAQEADPRLVTRVYDAAQIVRIHGRLGVQATIAFADDEKIENVAVGDSDKWQITPNKRANLLFARPLDPAASTNMTVVTDKRTYLFDLVASVKDRPVYMLSFTYKDAPPAVAAPPPAIAAQEPSPPPVLARAPQEVPPPPARVVEAMPAVPTLAEPDARPEIAQAVPEPVAPVPAAQLAEAPQPAVPEPEPEPPAVAQAAVTVQEPAPEPSAQPSPQPPVYRSAIDQAVGAPAEVLADASALQRAEADKPGDPEPVRIERPKRVRQAKAQPAANSGSAPQSREIAPAPEAATAIDAALPPEPGALNFAWNRSGKSALLPMRVYDDGRATYLVWGAKQTIPQVEVIGAQGEQVSPAMTRHENSIVILTVPSRIVFRADKASATLENLRPVRGTVLLSGPLPGGQAASAGTSP